MAIDRTDICLNCDNGYHPRYFHNSDGCQVVGCSCKLNVYTERSAL